MCIRSEQAIYLYNKAYHAEQQGEANLAEVYYLKSWFLFERAGGPHRLQAADALNALAFLHWSSKNYQGALRSAWEAMKIMEAQGPEFSGADADFIRDTSQELIDQVCYEMKLISGVKH